MKILVYVDPQSGGSLAMYDYSLIKGIKKHQVIYCCSTLYDAPVIEGVKYLPIFKYNRKKHIFKLFSYIVSLFRLVSVLRLYKPDTMHIQWWRLWSLDYLFLKIYKRYAKQVVFTAHNLVPHDSKIGMKKKCLKYYNLVDKIIVHENNAKKELIDFFAIKCEKIFVIPHGVLKLQCNDASVRKYIAVIKERYQLENKIVIASMGTQGFYKGTDLIRDAYLSSEKLMNTKDVVLLIAGRGNIFTDNISVFEYTNLIVNDRFMLEDEFEAYMRLVDVILLPYRRISQSGVLLTAIEKEIPFAVTPVGGLTEPFEIAQVGWIIRDASIESVRTFLEYIAENKKEIMNIKHDTVSWNKIKDYYNWENISEKTENTYLLDIKS